GRWGGGGGGGGGGKRGGGGEGGRRRPQEPSVDPHEIRATARLVLLVFEHRDAVPLQRSEQPPRIVAQCAVDRCALGKHACAAARRFFAEPAMREVGDDFAAIEQHED